jgi:hypothetical protein
MLCFNSPIYLIPVFFSVTDVLLWSGIDKGPPRKEKFPEPQELIRALEAVL